MWRRARAPRIVISDESAGLLDSAGGIVKALPELGGDPFYSSTPTRSGSTAAGSNLERLALAWDAARMDILIMLADPAHATGHSKGTDFVIDADGRLARAKQRAGRADLCRRGDRRSRASLPARRSGRNRSNAYFDRAIAAGRLYGMKMDGHWITVGTPDAIPLAERASPRQHGKGRDRRTHSARPVDPGRRAVPADAGRCGAGGHARSGIRLGRRTADAGRHHHLRADATRRARACAAYSASASAGAPRSCRRSARSASSTRMTRRSRRMRSGIDLAEPIAPLERLLALAPLVHAWKSRLPAHVAALFEEDVTIPASAADAIWLARDLAALIDEIETEGADWKKLGELASGNLAGWWQVTLDFLEIVTSHWPEALRERGRSNPAAHRNALIRMEAARLSRTPARRPGDRGRIDRLYPGHGRIARGDLALAQRRGGPARARSGA